MWRGAMLRPEAALHKTVKRYLDLVLPKSAWWSSIAHGEGGGKIRGAQWKSRGAKAGVPDILIVFGGTAHWVELKSAKGQLSPAQKECAEHLLHAGCQYKLARSIDDVRVALAAWQIPTREHGNLTAFHFTLEAA
jgi:hypothetical protein